MYFSTSGVDRAERRLAWQRSLMAVCGGFRTECRTDDFEASLELHRIGRLRCSRVTQSPGIAYRTAREVQERPMPKHILVMQIEGHSRMEQEGRSVELREGQMTVIDMMRPSHFSFDTRSVQISVHLAHGAESAKAGRCPHTAMLLPPAAGRLVGALVQSALSSNVDGPGYGAALEASIAAFLDAGWSEYGVPDDPSDLPRIQAYIADRLDEDLAPDTIAQANGISERTLHRLFAQSGTSVGTWLRRKRLECCAADLRNPCLAGCSITQIAFARGFNNVAHFSRTFRAQFAQSPSDYRSGTAAPRPVPQPYGNAPAIEWQG